MSDFEFLSVLVSIIVGLGLTRLLGGLGHAYHFRRVVKMDPVHVAWSVTIFFLLVLNWWVFLLFRDFDRWTFTNFFLIILWTTMMYMMAIALYPPGISENADYRKLFDQNRSWLLSTFATFVLLDILITFIREQGPPDLLYLGFVGHYVAIAVIGIGVKNRKFDLSLAWWIALTLAAWSFGVRHTLF